MVVPAPGNSTEKRRLRREVLGRRDALSKAYQVQSDKAIQAHLKHLAAYQEAHTIFCYISVGSEIDTRALIGDMLEEGKVVCVPRIVGGGVMHAHAITSLADLTSEQYGIPAPAAESPIVAPADIDLIIVPCLTCNRSGCRLGYGGGYYDRYLANVPRALKVIVCRESLMQEYVPSEEHDIHADIVIAESGIVSK